MKKIKSILTMLIIVLVVFFCLPTETTADLSTNNVITMDVKTDSDGNRLVGENGHVIAETDTIYITFTGSADMTGTATIYYSTCDASAVAKAKDYESTSGSLTINKENYKQTVSIKVGSNTFGVESRENSGVSTRYFKFIVTEFVYQEGTFKNAISDDTSKTVLCDIGYEHFYRTKIKNGKIIFSDYDVTVTDNEAFCANPGEVDTIHLMFKNDTNAYAWNTWYVNKGLADIYAGMEIAAVRKYGYEFLGADTRFYMYSMKNGSTLYEKFNLDYGRMSDGLDKTFENQCNNNDDDFVISNYGYKVLKLNPSQFGSYYYGVKITDSSRNDNPTTGYQLYATCDNADTGAGFQCTGQIYLYERVIDDIAPHATSVYGLTNNTSRLDGKIKVAVRMNEPVRVTNANNLYAKIKFDNYTYRYFKYVEGSETDTLVFEMDLKDAPSAIYSDIKFMGFFDGEDSNTKSTAIVDYSILANVVSNNEVVGKADYDFSNPKINEILTQQVDLATKLRVYNVEISNVNNGALYYMFSTDNTNLTYDPKTISLSEFLENYYSSSIAVTKDKTVYAIEARDNDGNYLDGSYYLHLFLLSGNGKGITTVDGRDGTGNPTKPYNFDSNAPKIDSYYVSGSIKTKTISLSLSDNNYSDGIKTIEVDGYKPNTYGNTKKTVWTAPAKNTTDLDYDLLIDINDIDIEDGSYGYYDFTVIITDYAGNITTLNLENLLFDTRDVFEIEEDLSTDAYLTTEYQEKVIVGSDNSITYTISTPTYAGNNLYIKSVKYGSLSYEATYDSHGIVNNSFDAELASALPYTQYPGSITLTPKKSGRLEIVFGLLYKNHVIDPDTSEIVSYENSYIEGIESMHFTYYCTVDFNDECVNYSSISQLEYVKNYLYTIPNVNYYYVSTTGEKTYSSYTTAGAPVFSTRAKASEFIRYFELQDLYVIHLDNSYSSEYIINCLNNRDYSSSYAKSRTEDVVAKPNQYWVRYKESTWTYGQSVNNGWVYYYLSDSSPLINASNLPQALKNSIDKITEYIVSQGKYQYFAGVGYVDSLGRPNVKTEQIISETLDSLTETKTGSKFVSPLYLEKDYKIFDSYYYTFDASGNIIGKTPLLMYYYPDLTTDKNVRFFYTQKGTNNYREITNIGSNPLDYFFPEDQQCIYEIIELGTQGARKYEVYVDKKAPVLNIKYTSSGEETINPISTTSSLSVKDIHFLELVDGDIFSYITITSNSGTMEPITCLLTELKDKTINLPDGKYTIYISDRYGNAYQFYLQLKKTEIEMTEEDEMVRGNACLYVAITNRTLPEIAFYSVYLNGELYSSTPTLEAKYTESGIYTIVVTDIYGYTEKRENVVFKRALPTVSWTYYNNGKYTHYESDENPPLTITSSNDKGLSNVYIVKTSVTLNCIFPREYTFSFADNFKDYIVINENGYSRVVIQSLTEWSLTIYYEGDNSTKVSYVCMIDNLAPIITASYDVNTYIISDYNDINAKASKETEEGVVIEGSSAIFEPVLEKTYKTQVIKDSIIYSRKIMLSVKDDNMLGSVTVTLDGKPYEVSLEDILAGEVELTGYGKYVITAKDVFGNTSTFTFTNSDDFMVERKVDGTMNNDTVNTFRGNTSDTLLVNYDSIIVYKITTNGESKLYMFRINSLGLSTVLYKTVEVDGVMTWAYINDVMLFATNDPVSQLNVEVSVGTSPISVKLTDKGYLFKVSASDERMDLVYSIKADNYSECLTFYSVLSQELTDVVLVNKTDSSLVKTNQKNDIILVHDEFMIQYPLKDEISSISFGYSSSNIPLSDYDLTDIDIEHSSNITTTEDGFYVIVIVNKFGNTLVYKITKYVNILVETKVEYASGDYNTYSTGYSDLIYSNNKVTVALYDDNEYTSFTVEKFISGSYVLQDVEATKENNMYYVEITESGKYRVTVVDYYGNTSIKAIEIKKTDLNYDDSLIVGFNDTALEKYYTNSILSINKAALVSFGYVYVKVDDVVLYNVISENDKIDNENLLVGCIGENDVRKTYVVTFRDKYGNECEREIYYSAYSSLKVERNYMVTSKYEEVDYTKDVYSNNSIKLTSDINDSKFIIDGVEVQAKELEYSFAKDGNFTTHLIEYKDVYGFVHEFNIYILRQDISINVLGATEEKQINGLFTVKGSFSLSYTKDSTCIYTVDNQEAKEYNGEVFENSGVYYFTVVDLAGNKATLRVKLDNVCEYEFVEYSTGQAMYSGKVTDSRVRFDNINGDLVSIYKVLKDGKEYEVTNNAFTEHGVYHVTVKDEIGNQSEFDFTIITHKLSSYSYTAPLGYTIVDIYVEVSSEFKDHYLYFEPEGFEIKEDGKYTVVLKNDYTNVTDTFSFEIDNTKPNISLNVELTRGATKEDVVITGFENGDTVFVYKNNKLIETIEIRSQKSITITEAGQYKVVVTNEAGLETTVSFKKEFVMNTAGSVLIIISCAALSTILMVGLVLRKRPRVDK